MTEEMKKINDEKKKWLRRYINLTTEKCFYAEKLSRLDNIKAQKMSAMPMSQSAIHDRIAESICDLDEIEHKHVKETVNEMNRVKMEIYQAIEKLDDSKVKVVMLYRYIDGLNWKEISQKIGYEEAQVHRFHALGLDKIEIAEAEEHKIA